MRASLCTISRRVPFHMTVIFKCGTERSSYEIVSTAQAYKKLSSHWPEQLGMRLFSKSSDVMAGSDIIIIFIIYFVFKCRNNAVWKRCMDAFKRLCDIFGSLSLCIFSEKHLFTDLPVQWNSEIMFTCVSKYINYICWSYPAMGKHASY